MSFTWIMSLRLTRDEILNDKEIEITGTTVQNNEEMEEEASLVGAEGKAGGLFTYYKNHKDGKWYLAETGYHSGMEPILHHLHDKYGEYFKEDDDWMHDFSYDEEDGPIVDTWQEGDILNRLYAVAYMYSLGFLHDQNEPVKEGLFKDYDYDFVEATFKRYGDRIRLTYYPFIHMLLSKEKSNYKVIADTMDLMEKRMPGIFANYPVCDTYFITKRDRS